MAYYWTSDEYISDLIICYITDRFDNEDEYAFPDLYSKIRQRAIEIEATYTIQPIDFDPGSANYEAFEMFIGNDFSETMTVDKFCKIFAISALIARSCEDLTVLYDTIRLYVSENQLGMWFIQNVFNFGSI